MLQYLVVILSMLIKFESFYYLGGPDAGEVVPGYLKGSVLVSPSDSGLSIRFNLKTPYIVSKVTTRDANFTSTSDNAFVIVINPDFKRLSALYVFAINPEGIKSDYKVINDKKFFDWDANWKSTITMDKKIWGGEVLIPYSITQNWGDTIGICFIRFTYDSTGLRKFLVTGLSGDFRVLRPENFARIEIKKPSLHPSFEIIPYFVISGDWYKSRLNSGIGFKFKCGHTNFNFVYSPDYAEVEADKYQFDLFRKGIFLPEKRPFFKNISDLVNIHVPYGKLFYSRSFEKIDYALAMKHNYYRHIFLFMGIKSDSVKYRLFRWKYDFNTSNLQTASGIALVHSNLEDKFFYGDVYSRYIPGNCGCFINGELKFAREFQSKAEFYSGDWDFRMDSGKNNLYLNAKFSRIGDFNLSKGILYFKNVKTAGISISGSFYTGQKFIKYISSYLSLEKIDGTRTRARIHRGFYYSLNFNILSRFNLRIVSYKFSRMYNESIYNNQKNTLDLRLNIQNLNTEFILKFSNGNMWGKSINIIDFSVSGAFRKISYEISQFVYAYSHKFRPEIFLTPFRKNTMFQFDIRVSYRFRKVNFLRVFIERETFENTNTLNLMYEKEFPDVNSIFYIVINSKYNAVSKYFNLPSKKDFKWAIKLSYAFKI